MKRDMERANLAGVCAGMGRYFDISPFWMRLIFVVMFLHLGVGVLAYIILWLMMEKG